MTLFRYASQAIGILQNNSSSSEVSPEVKMLCRRLDQNELEELELGWYEKEYRYTRKEIQQLCHSLYDNSSLKRVFVGSRLEKSALQDSFLPAIASLSNLQVLQLEVYSALEESTIQSICQNPSLQQLDITGARLRRKSGIITRNRYQMEDYAYEDASILGVLSHLSHSRTIGRSHLKSLTLAKCAIQDKHIGEICKHQLPIDHLCLSGNAGITSKGLERLLASNNIRRLDVTECSIQSLEGVALESSTTQELILSRNYCLCRWEDDSSFLSFFSAASKNLQLLDLSFCNWNSNQIGEMFRILKHSDCCLKALILKGSRNVPVPDLCDMLEHNKSLLSLVLHSDDEAWCTRVFPIECYTELFPIEC